jgi:DNA-binding beta-propeller fold protein YncE
VAASRQKQPKTLGKKDHVLKYEALLIGRRRGNVKRLPRSTWAIDAALVCVFAKVAIALGLGWALLPGHLSATAPKNFDPLPLKQVADIRMPGPAVRFDYQSLDTSSGRLYIAHMNANQLVVFDTRRREVIANLDGFSSVHGVWAVPDLGRVYAAVTGEHKVAVVDMKTLKTLAKVGPVKYPDGIAYAPGPQRVFVSDEHGDADAVIDAKSNSLVATIALGGGAGNTVYDSVAARILVAVHEKNELVAIDPTTAKIIGRYPVTGVASPHGISLDVDGRLAFVAGEENHKLAVLDLNSMKVLATHPVGEDPDVLAFDPGLKLLYVAAESGQVTVFREQGKSLIKVGQFFMPHAHTVCVDPETHLVYFPLENVQGRPVLRIMEPIQLP